ncbi:MAG: response regulator [Paludibacter sp.]|nr:response regulator [Paludibacter sp.]
MKNKIKLFLVDDDVVYLKSLEMYFRQYNNFTINTYSTGENCIENLAKNPDIIILDYQLNGIDKESKNGIEILDGIKAYNQGIPVVMLSSQDKIEVAVNCMLHKSCDYVVKSETVFIRLKNKINAIFKFKKIQRELNWYMERM